MKYSPQEIEVWYVLPEIRKQLALALKKQGLSQKQIAEKLGVSAATITHYMKNKRAGNFDLGKDVNSFIEKSAKKIAGTKGYPGTRNGLSISGRRHRRTYTAAIKSIAKSDNPTEAYLYRFWKSVTNRITIAHTLCAIIA